MSKNLWLWERTSVAGSLNSRISLCLRCQHPKWVLVYVPAAPLLTSLPMNGLGMWQRTAQGLVPLHSCGKPRRSSWLWIGPAPVIAVIWEMNQWLEDSVSCSHCFCDSTFQIKMKWMFFKKRIPVENCQLYSVILSRCVFVRRKNANDQGKYHHFYCFESSRVFQSHFSYCYTIYMHM